MDNAPPRAEAAPRPRTRRVWGLFALLLAVSAGAAYVIALPKWRARQLPTASLARLQALAAENPNDGQTLYYLGLRQREAGDTAAALATFQRALPLSPDAPDVWVAAAELVQERQPAAATQLLEQFLKTHPDAAPVHLALARLSRRQRLWERAYVEAKAVTQLDPTNGLGWQLYGQAAGMTERPKEAGPALQKAVALAPGSWEAQTSMGDLLVGDKRYADALPYFREAIRLAPDRANPYLSLGLALLKTEPNSKTLEEARQSLLRCRTLRPDIPTTYLYLGQCYEQLGQWEAARDALEEARRRDPNNRDVYFEAGKIFSHLGDTDAAAKAYARHKQLTVFTDEQRVLLSRIERAEQDGKMPEADTYRLELARKLTANAMYGDAIGHYQRLLLHTPDRDDLRRELAAASSHAESADALALQGEALLHQKRYPQAAAAFEAAIAREPRNARAWEGRGIALASSEQMEKAIPAFLQATRLDAKRPWAQLAVGEAYAQFGLLEEARPRLQVAAGNEATQAGAASILKSLPAVAPATPLARYVRASLQLLRHPDDAAARKERDDLAQELKASGELPPVSLLESLLKASSR